MTKPFAPEAVLIIGGPVGTELVVLPVLWRQRGAGSGGSRNDVVLAGTGLGIWVIVYCWASR